MVRAWVIEGDFGLDHLVMKKFESTEPGPMQVRIKMQAASLNYRDLVVLDGNHGPMVQPPLVPLSDGCGVVDAVGDGVSEFKVGDRVCPLFFRSWFAGAPPQDLHAQLLGGPNDGVLNTHVIANESAIIDAPENLSATEAATLPCAGLTAWSALTTPRPMLSGETVLILGTGGVALFALQFAKIMGCRTIMVTSNDEKAERLTQLGADHVLNYNHDSNWHKSVKRLTEGYGVNRVLELGGAQTIERSIRAVQLGGTVILIGNISGNDAHVSLPLMLTRQIGLQAVSVGHKQSFAAMNTAIRQHAITPIIDRVFPFENAPAAFSHLRSGGHIGKVCISI